MQCPKCRKESTGKMRCTLCGASMVSATAQWNKPVAEVASASAAEAVPSHSTSDRPWWLTKSTIAGTILILVGSLAMSFNTAYILTEGTRQVNTGITILAQFEFGAVLAGVILWGFAIRRKFPSGIKGIVKSASKKFNEVVSRVTTKDRREDPMETIKRLKELADQGVISEAEFAQKKAELITKI